MIDWLVKKLTQLLDTLLDPLWRRVLVLPWPARVAMVALLIGAVLVGLHLQQAGRYLAIASRLPTAMQHSADKSMRLSVAYQARITDSIARLAASLESSVARSNKPDYGNWAPAQLVVSLNGLPDARQEVVSQALRARADPSCGCWREFAQASSPRNVLVSGWALFALGRTGAPASLEQLAFLTGAQKDDGWWPIYPSSDRGEYASTYATAWAMLGLNEQLRRGQVPAEQVDLVTEAVRRGSSWLVNHRIPNRARWYDYPFDVDRRISESLSGLVIYTLHEVGTLDLQDIDRQWLAGLPPSPPQADTCEIRNVWTETLDGPQMEAYCQLTLPWQLIATTHAYGHGTPMQKAVAMIWVENVLDATDILHSETISGDWIRAETLIALRDLGSDTK